MRFVEDYPATVLNDAWDFDEGDPEGLTRREGVTDPKVVSGRLLFRTLGNARLVWGNFDSNSPVAGELHIAEHWWQQAWPWVVQIKLRQSAPVSNWSIEAAYYKHGSRRVVERSTQLRGSQEQILQFDMGTAIQPYFALSLSTDTPGNEVSHRLGQNRPPLDHQGVFDRFRARLSRPCR